MPELPDLTVYLERIRDLLLGAELETLRVKSPFLLRTVQPPLQEVEGKRLQGVARIGKRLVLEMEGDLYLVLHLMIAGRLRWKPKGASLAGRHALAAFDFPDGTLLLTEASSKKRCSLYLVKGEEGLKPFQRGGLEVLDADLSAFAAALGRENHTLKRALTDPRLFSGIGNAYSDEILFRARLSPMQLTGTLDAEGVERLFTAAQLELRGWTDRLRAEVGTGFPDRVTAFRPEMAVHGRYRQPCPECGAPVQRIRYAANECNYCPPCQTAGRLLADRGLSRLLRKDWPRTLEELEELRGTGSQHHRTDTDTKPT